MLSSRTPPSRHLDIVPAPGARHRVTAAEFARQFGQWCRAANTEPLFVTHHGQETHVLLTASLYDALTGVLPGVGSANPLPALDELAEWIAQGMLICDGDGTVRLANRVAHTLCRRTPGTIEGSVLWSTLPELERSPAAAYIRRAETGGEPSSADLPSPFRDNAWIRLEAFPLAGGVAVLIRDITEDVQRHRLADLKEALMGALMAHGGVGYARLNPRGRIERIDSPLSAMLKLPEERLIGLALADLVPISGRVLFRELFDQVMRGGGPARFETELLANDGSVLAMQGAMMELRGAYGAEGAVVVVTPRAGA